jgi:dihydroorotase
MSASLHIRGGRIVDPSRGRDEIADLFVRDGVIADRPAAGARIVDARGLVLAPGFIDLHVHLREPGGEENETIETGSRAAARGGFTTIVAMPNTRPPHDTAETVAFVKKRGEEIGLTRVLPSGAITRGRQGRDLADAAALKSAGAIALTDDGSTVQDDTVMESAMRAARSLDLVIMDHAQDRVIEQQGGVMHQGVFSEKFGLPGIPTFAEERIIRRDIELAEETGCRLHIQHVTSRAGVDLIRAGRARGIRVTGELTPHHLALCDADIDPAAMATKSKNTPFAGWTLTGRPALTIRAGRVVFTMENAPS